VLTHRLTFRSKCNARPARRIASNLSHARTTGMCVRVPAAGFRKGSAARVYELLPHRTWLPMTLLPPRRH
jgi:hypothetical protein